MSEVPVGAEPTVGRERAVPLRGFALEALEQESARMRVPVEDLVGFAVLYYLADVDSGRIARRIARGPYPGTADRGARARSTEPPRGSSARP